MIGRKIFTTTAALATCLVAIGDAPRALACPSCGGGLAPQAATTTYRPLYAPAPSMSQTVNYMPFTGYRTVLMPTPVATLQPAPACNACGGASTVMRPVTSYAMRPQLVPYTSYQPVAVAAPPVIAAPACNACAATPRVAMFAPAAPVFGVPLVNSQLTMSTGLRPIYTAPAVAPACGCSAAGPAPMMGMVGASVPSLVNSADVAPTLSSGQPMMSQPMGAASGPSTTFAPSSSLYGGAGILGSGSTNSATLGTPVTITPIPENNTIINNGTTVRPVTPIAPPPPPVSPPNDAPGGPDLSTPATSGADASSDAPRKTFRADKPADEPRTRLVPKKAFPTDSQDSSPKSGDSDASGSSGAPISPSSRETNFDRNRRPIRQPVASPEDRMTSRPVRQATYYRPIAIPTAASPVTLNNSAANSPKLDDSGWQPASSR